MTERRIQDRLYVDEKDEAIVDKIKKLKYFNFAEKNKKDQFLFAMAIGVNSGISEHTISKRKEWFHTNNLHPDDEALIKACAIYSSNSVEVLSDMNEVYKIAQEYAHIGFRILEDMIESSSFGSFEKKFEAELMDIFKEVNINQ